MYVRNTRSPSRMNALWPCHSSTPKSASKLSVMVYQGILQPIRAFRRAMSACGASETKARVVSPAFGGQRVTGAGMGLLLREQLLARRLPRPRRHDRTRGHGGRSAFPIVLG